MTIMDIELYKNGKIDDSKVRRNETAMIANENNYKNDDDQAARE